MIAIRELDLLSEDKKKFVRKFYKENGLWYIDLPEFIEGGYGTKANLLMVDGSDSMLDILSNYAEEVLIEFKNYYETRDSQSLDAVMNIMDFGKNQDLLEKVKHAPVESGAYYWTTVLNNNIEMRTWLCPVAHWVFGSYPEKIFVTIVRED